MISTRRNLLIGGAASLAGAVLLKPAFADSAADAPAAPARLAPPLLGEVDAPKRLVVWGSCTCPFTAQLYGVLRGVVTDMKETVSVEWRHFPTHAPDPALHVAALGFEGLHFWGFSFRVLGAVYAAGGKFDGLTPEKLIEFARTEGGSEKTLKDAYADTAKWAAVKEDLLAGRLLGVTRTPGLFYNGYFMTPEGLPMNTSAFDKSLRAMLTAG